ncbi:MAG: KUP/HAK/KT family potassium transporter [Pseudomonadota bacterium]|jgi:KUP system potassium uptake protein
MTTVAPAGDGEKANLNAMAIAALGVVYGDLGTSPLYTLQTVLSAVGGHPSADTALGVLSLILWTLIITISVKYCAFVMRADNHGEGGIMALMSLVGVNGWRKGAYVGATMGLLGAALIYGDGVITPAISVLSALEGVNVATSALKPFVLPAAVVVLILLFAAQRFGTASIGRAFGPIMLCWFGVIGLLGLWGVIQHPVVISAINPLLGLALIAGHPAAAAGILGGVFLCATGGEALYADMGHFGAKPIQRAWYVIVLPSLFLCYAGQTGQLIAGVKEGANPFFAMAPTWALYPLVALATAATIIASQAIITGSFSMTRQAIQLGWLPAVQIRQTSDQVYGQIYVPLVNVLMAAGTLTMTLVFRSSDALAGAFGMAVATTMVLTTCLLWRAMHVTWRWPLSVVLPLGALFITVDLAFFFANLAKILEGGWIPLTLGVTLFAVMVIWRSGMQTLRARLAGQTLTPDAFFAEAERSGLVRAPGCGVYLTRTADQVPPFIIQYARQMGSLHQTAIALHVEFEECPRVPADRRATVTDLGHGLWRVTMRYGFVEIPNVARELVTLPELAGKFDPDSAVYFGARDLVECHKRGRLDRLRLGLFTLLHKNAARVSDRFVTPIDRTVELARHVEI